MGNIDPRIVLTGFMGVGKTTVARHLSYMVRGETIDLDAVIAEKEEALIPEIFKAKGEALFRALETKYLGVVLDSEADIISLGGGAWTTERNREIVKEKGLTSIWLESTFDHCWRNIKFSRLERPLVEDKENVRKLFDERQKYYCLADWHFVIKPGNNSFDVAKQIASEVFG